MNIKQHGVGLVEVLVALVLLAIGVLGFAALQLKAIDASAEASNQVIALTIARDLAERMRANPQGVYPRGVVTALDTFLPDDTTAVTPSNLVMRDLQNVALQAKNNGMNIAVSVCPLTDTTRQCIYVAWDETSLVGEKGIENCIKDKAYVSGSHCLFLEAY
ncbi:type IV pilus modification protein PilV [Acinetobacter vivianii]|uniref:type IV pilus modification protein PilV n=1 Tax=Acinetobacter vivianii TaxID=1776742 RepID=UPI0040437C7B